MSGGSYCLKSTLNDRLLRNFSGKFDLLSEFVLRSRRKKYFFSYIVLFDMSELESEAQDFLWGL